MVCYHTQVMPKGRGFSNENIQQIMLSLLSVSCWSTRFLFVIHAGLLEFFFQTDSSHWGCFYQIVIEFIVCHVSDIGQKIHYHFSHNQLVVTGWGWPLKEEQIRHSIIMFSLLKGKCGDFSGESIKKHPFWKKLPNKQNVMYMRLCYIQ